VRHLSLLDQPPSDARPPLSNARPAALECAARRDALASAGPRVYASDMAITQETFRAAMGQMASGVTIVTMHAGGEDHGFTATSFTSLSLDPMLVLVCVVKDQRSHAMLEQAGHYAVNILGSSHKALGLRFADPLASDRFSGLDVGRSESGAPILVDSLAWVDCRVVHVLPGGDHSIFVGEVIAGEAAGNQDALVYYNRHWGRFARDA
jgi:flavin reductase (DIM6/NTAB) family NADH-FMN oxidoreductase RutF